jgi:hypothetical protein
VWASAQYQEQATQLEVDNVNKRLTVSPFLTPFVNNTREGRKTTPKLPWTRISNDEDYLEKGKKKATRVTILEKRSIS